MRAGETVGTEFQMNSSSLLVKSGEGFLQWCFLLNTAKRGVIGRRRCSILRNELLVGFSAQ